MLRSFVDARRKGLRQFFKDGKIFSKVAEEVLPLAEEWHLQGNISDTDHRLISAMASMYKLNLSLMEGEVNTDFMSGLSPVGQLSVQFMSEEIEALIREKQDYAKNRERLESELKILRQREKEAEHSASQLQDVVTENKRLSTDVENLKKALVKQRQFHSKIRSQMQEFRIGAYLKYKVLSKLMFGGMRRRYREKYQEQKRIYRAIRKGDR